MNVFHEVPLPISEQYGLKRSSIKALKVSSVSGIFSAELDGQAVVIKAQPIGEGSLNRVWIKEVYDFLLKGEFEAYARPLPNGNLVDCERDSLLWTMFEYVSSDEQFNWLEGGWNARHCRELGVLLSKLHALNVSDLELPQSSLLGQFDLFPGDNNFASYLSSSLEAMASRFALSIEQRLLAALDRKFAQCAETVRASCLKTNCFEDLFAGKALVHSDAHFGNVRFRDGKAYALIDFDYAHVNTPAYDLGYALFTATRKFGEDCDGPSASASVNAYESRKNAIRLILKRMENCFLENGHAQQNSSPLDTDVATELLMGYLGGSPDRLQNLPKLLLHLTPNFRLAAFLVLSWLIEQLGSEKSPEGDDSSYELELQIRAVSSCLRALAP